MPFCLNGDVRLHYRIEGSAQGPPLVLQHGFSMSLHDWYELGYVAVLGDRYRLILLDARGHGASDRPHAPEAYRFTLRAADVVAVLDDLDVGRAHFLGYSMGGAIGYAVATHAPDRLRSLTVGGASAAERNPADPDRLLELLRQGKETYVKTLADWFGPVMTPALRARILDNDLEALIASRTLSEHRGFEQALSRLAIPCLLFVGEDDPAFERVKATAARVPHATFVSFPGVDHGNADRLDLVLPHLTRFLAAAEEAPRS
jgi:pimeloyl-ACP methyl ester carboxylesterase